MANIAKLFKGLGFFITAYLVMVLVNYIVPPTVEAMETTFSSNADLEGVIWFGLIILYTIIGIVIPAYYMITSLREPSDNPILEAVIGVCLFIFSLFLTIKAWSWVTAFASLSAGHNFTLALFWLGFFGIWLTITFITPGYLIVNAYNVRSG